MRTLLSLTLAATVSVSAAPAIADSMTYYPYHTHVNYCPHGLQPIVMAGVICCGSPNTHTTWQEVMRHPTPVRHYTPAKSTVCQEGEKGC